MELFLFKYSEYERLYNCSKIEIDQIPLNQRQHPLAASILICLCAIYYILYVPCLFSIARQMRTKPCYQILFFMAIADLCVLWIIGFGHGILSLEGAVFCSHPTFIYLAGNLAVFCWMLESSAAIFLAINRCMELMDQRISDRIFTNRLIWVWFCAISLLPIYRFIFVKPILFNGPNFQWYFNPFEGYLPDDIGLYRSKLAEVFNVLVAVILPILYSLFAFTLFYKIRMHSSAGNGRTDRQNRTEIIITIQVFLISLMNTVNCTLFVLMQRFDFDWAWLNYLTHFSWLHIHGFPPVIYLLLNKTVRNDCKALLKRMGKTFHLTEEKANKIQIQVLFVQPRPSDHRISSAQPEKSVRIVRAKRRSKSGRH